MPDFPLKTRSKRFKKIVTGIFQGIDVVFFNLRASIARSVAAKERLLAALDRRIIAESAKAR